MLISDFMSTCIAECTEDTPVDKVYDLIQKCEHGFVVVIDSERHRVPLGVVSEHSICEQIVGKGRKIRGLTAGGSLDSRIKKISDTMPSKECATLLENTELAAVVVTNNRGELCGIVPFDAFAAILAAARNELPATHDRGGNRRPEVPERPGLRWAH